jgi:uncharacterized membrane protein
MAAGRSEVVAVTAAVLVLGLASAAVVPPGQCPDEGFSFLRAYHVADGHLRPERFDGWGGGRFPPGVVRVVMDGWRMADHPDEKFTAADWQTLAELDESGPPQVVTYYTAAPYTFVPFLPQAAGVRVGRLLGGPLAAFYAGRVANVLFGTALVALALGLAPAGRRFLGLVALLPMTAHLFGSYAPEVGVIGAGLLVPAVVLRLAVAARPAAWWELALVVAAVAWVGASKPPYLPVAALVLAVPPARLGGRAGWLGFAGVVCAVGGLVGAAGVEAARPYYPDPHVLFGYETSVRGQTRFARENPGAFARAFAEATVARAVPTYARLFKLGWLDTPIHPAAVAAYTAALALLAAAGRAEVPRGLPRWPAALAVGGGLVLTVFSLYVWCEPVGSRVAGLHGRYLLPLLPAALFLAPGRVPRWLASDAAQRRAAWGTAGVVAVVALATVARRYYV